MHPTALRCLIAAALLATPAAAQEDPASAHSLHLLLSRDGRDGGALVAPAAAGALYEEGMYPQWVELAPGEYLFAAACDTACGDLDVHVFDAAGTSAGSDVDPRPHALVDLVVRRPGRYRVQVRMIACRAEPCRFTSGVFRLDP